MEACFSLLCCSLPPCSSRNNDCELLLKAGRDSNKYSLKVTAQGGGYVAWLWSLKCGRFRLACEGYWALGVVCLLTAFVRDLMSSIEQVHRKSWYKERTASAIVDLFQPRFMGSDGNILNWKNSEEHRLAQQ